MERCYEADVWIRQGLFKQQKTKKQNYVTGRP